MAQTKEIYSRAHTSHARARITLGGGYVDENLSTKEKIIRLKKSGKPKKILENLLDQLERAGNKNEYYTDLVEDYITMWSTKELLKQDIEERGVRVWYENGGGQCGYKKNESVEQLVKINAQMLKLLSELKITPANGGGDSDELL